MVSTKALVKRPQQADSGALKAEFSQIERIFANFYKFRGQGKTYDQLVNRDLETTLPADITTLTDYQDYRSPNPADALAQYIDILTMNPTRFDAVINGAARKDRQTERTLTLYHAHTWADMDEDRFWDAGSAEGQAKHGIKVWRLCHKPLDKVTIEPGVRRNPFYWQSCVVDGCGWLGDYKDPDAFWYKYSLPVIGSGLKNSAGEKPTLDEKGLVGWLGQDQSMDYSRLQGKKLDVYIRDARDLDGALCDLEGCNHQKRVITCYVTGEGGSLDTASEAYSEFSPFQFCSFVIVPGVLFQTETDPHSKFRPKMEKLYSLTIWDNYLTTTLATLSRAESGDQDIYLNIGQANPQLVSALVTQPEGGPSFNIDRPQPGSNQIAAMIGKLERWPKPTSQHLMSLLAKNREELIEAMPNRFMTGNANSEASNATAAAFSLSLEQSSLPFGRLLSLSDGAIGKSQGKMQPHAIRYWAQDEETPWQYSVVLTGSEGALRHSASPGEVIMVSADTFDCDYELVVKTENRTLADREREWYLALNQFQSKVLTSEDLVKAAGKFDVQGQMRLLRRDDLVSSMQPLRVKMQRLYLIRQYSIKTGIDFGSLDPEIQAARPAVPPGSPNPMEQQAAAMARQGNSTQQMANNQTPPALPQFGGGASPLQ